MNLLVRRDSSVGPFSFRIARPGHVLMRVFGPRMARPPPMFHVRIAPDGVHYRSAVHTHTGRAQDAVNPLEDTSFSNRARKRLQMTQASALSVLDTLNARHVCRCAWRWVGACAAISGGLSVLVLGWGGATLAAISLGAGATALAHLRDTLRKSVVMLYEIDRPLAQMLAEVHMYAMILQRSRATCSTTGHDARAAGVEMTFGEGPPDHIKTNVSVPRLMFGGRTLYIFPDRVLVRSAGRICAIDFSELHIQMLRDSILPGEAAPTDRRRRWRDGRVSKGASAAESEPVCRCGRMRVEECERRRETVHIPLTGMGQPFSHALERWSRAMSRI